jgi:glucose/arabinose dehydrogenase
MKVKSFLVLLSLAVGAGPVAAADAVAGKAFFRAQCALCHSAEPNDNGGAQGPSLHALIGRSAATASGFSYTPALKASGLSWDAASLDRFLTAPATVVPGSSMVVAVPKQADRENVVAYFAALTAGTFKDGPAPRGFGPPPGGPPPVAATGNADWKLDKPGRMHLIDVKKLPAPFASASVANFPRLIEKPADAKLQLPPGFSVEVFAKDLTGPRTMRVAPNGDIFLAETNAGRIKVLRQGADGKLASVAVFAQGLLQPYGVEFYPAGPAPQWVYIAETNRVVRYAYQVGNTAATGVPEVIIPELSPVGGGHFTRDIAFSPDGKRMYVSVGSQTNFAENMAKKTLAEAMAWDAERGVGATWDNEENRAGVRVFEMGGAMTGKNYANGIRNCVGMTVQPATGALWCATNERDMLGDDLVPDYATRVKEGGFYGWPWYYMGNYEEPRLKGERPDLKGKAIVPDVPFQAHSAAVNVLFYTAATGASAFPAAYRGDAFAVLHGSWNRAFRTGHKIVRLPMKNGVPTGAYQDFMTGFIASDGNVWGRPVAITVAKDGSLLLSDDGANLIYRIAYARGR